MDLKVGPIMAFMESQIIGKDNVTIFTNGTLEGEALKDPILIKAQSRGFTIEHRPIARLEPVESHHTEVKVHFTDGDSSTVGFLFHKPPTALSEDGKALVEQLGLEVTPGGDIKVEQPFGAASVGGVYAAGDCMTAMKAFTNAQVSGIMAGGGVNHALLAEE
ncbi:hypothetical protein MNV49_000989 [Pseudohyphozyma bogoriensis]|nr:hypothetical protein MNV49_000989 [Pseudohyphozyma bogoriensis]